MGLLSLSVAILAPGAWAGTAPVTHTVCVGCAVDSIQAAVNSATSGDTIEVGPGTWSEAVVVTAGVTIRAQTPRTALLDAGTGYAFTAGSPDPIVIEGFDMLGASGGLLQTDGPWNVQLVDIAVDGLTPPPGERAITAAGGVTLRVERSTFANVSAPATGGAVVGALNSTVILDQVTIRDVDSAWGGAIWTSGSDLTVQNSTIERASATALDGGAIYTQGLGSVVLTDTSFTTCTAVGSGGQAALFNFGTRQVVRCTFLDGYAGAHGGAVAGAFDVQDSTFEANEAVFDGGALWTQTDPITVTGGTFLQNKSQSSGGGVAAVDGAGLDVSDSLFVGNEATYGGGGAVYQNWAGDASLSNTTFRDNIAGSSGAAAKIEGDPGATLVRDCTFEDNTAGLWGGGVFLFQRYGGTLLEDNRFVRNRALEGGGLWMGRVVGAEVRRTWMCGNLASYGAGGALAAFDYDNLGIQNSLLVDNAAADRGGAATFYTSVSDVGSVELENNDVLGNASVNFGTGVDVDDIDSLSYVNVLTAFQTAPGTATAAFVAQTNPAFLLFGLWFDNGPGHLAGDTTLLGPTNLVDVDPMLEGYTPGAPCEQHNYARLLGSPLHDAGDPGLFDADGSRSDIGAYGGEDAPNDPDGDGSLFPMDCERLDPNVHPGALELCNSLDDDCDGAIDEGLASVPEQCNGLDDNCDGTIDEGFASIPEACNGVDDNCDGSVDEGFASIPEACNGVDDNCNGSVDEGFASIPELCNGVDDDCDGLVDEEATDGTEYYVDSDGDGWGGDVVVACEPPAGHVLRGGDCRDDLPEVYPGAPDDPNDGKDDDCDGIDPEAWLEGGQCGCRSGGGSGAWLLPLLLVAMRRSA